MDIKFLSKIDETRANKIFWLIFGLLIAGSIFATYWRIIVKRDYVIVAQAECDPYTEKCFTHICNPDPEVDGECTGDVAEDTWYTKNLHRVAYNIPECDPEDENCRALMCEENEKDCFYEFCNQTNLPEGDTCNDPEQYTKDNPIEENKEECVLNDEDCAIVETESGASCDSESDDICPMAE